MVVRRLRQRTGLSQTSFATLAGFHQSFISLLESGNKQLGGRQALIDLLNGLGLSADLSPSSCPPSRISRGPLSRSIWTRSCHGWRIVW
ncbi:MULTISPECIES: helix-turn-helix transcriptional regulator [unclassified Streptomyces]|uniref:helix-turn-helix domain-containing protein n=1 Tax=unclassified Streptomyces TaxID=2593676 RepID=UPI0031F90DE2